MAAIRRDPPDVVVVDIALGTRSGLELIRTLAGEHPQMIVLALSMYDETLYAERCLRAGAMGYIMKSEGHEKILEGIRQLLAGKSYVAKRCANKCGNRR
ncbi:MAG: response regulator transcription factor [Candidatus Moduliflexus flocculans]|nr:response regulator transcription factor [Candidatus Moduliflexus flocculans]